MSDPSQQASGGRRQLPQLDLASAAAAITAPDQHHHYQATSPHQEKDAARAISRTGSWKPRFERRLSYDMEDQKRHLQMTGVAAVKEEPGFSERR